MVNNIYVLLMQGLLKRYRKLKKNKNMHLDVIYLNQWNTKNWF